MTAYHHGVLMALPWVLGFLDHCPVELDDAAVFVPEVEEESVGKE